MTIGIVSVSYNSAAVIEDFLTSLNAQLYKNWRLYLIDNASDDKTADIVTNHLNARIYWIPLQYNTGFARGSNIGIQKAIADNCDNILLINNDVEFKPDFLFLLSEELKSSEADIVAPKIYSYHPKNRIWSAGGGFKPDNAWAAYHRGLGEVETGQYDSNQYCDFVTFCCVLFKTSVFKDIGFLDEKFFAYSEDADWFYRAKLAGVKLLYCYKPAIWHKVSSLTGGTHGFFGASYGTRNRVYFIRKHFSGFTRKKYLSKYFAGMFLAVIITKYTPREFCWRLSAFFKGLKL